VRFGMQCVELLSRLDAERDHRRIVGPPTLHDEPIRHRHAPIVQPPGREENQIGRGGAGDYPRGHGRERHPSTLPARLPNPSRECGNHRERGGERDDVEDGERHEVGGRGETLLKRRIRAG